MPLSFEPTTPQDRPELVRFLLDVFQLPPDSLFVRPDLLEWKFDRPRPDWEAPRSYVFRRDGEILSHGCIWPVTYLTPEGPLTSMRVIDWAGTRTHPGSGAMLMRKMASVTETVLAVGGSEETQKVVPAIGFRRTGDFYQYARVLRPWRQMRTYPVKNWKTPIRFLRNALWSRTPAHRAPAGWSWRPLPRFGDEQKVLVENPPPVEGWIGCRRTVGMLNYLLDCPAARMSAFLIEREGKPCGYGILSHVRGQTRISDLHVTPGSPENWRNAYALAVEAARRDPECAEVVSWVSAGFRRTALQSCGFRALGSEPVFLYDPRKRIVPPDDAALPLDLQLLDGDEFFLADALYPYST